MAKTAGRTKGTGTSGGGCMREREDYAPELLSGTGRDGATLRNDHAFTGRCASACHDGRHVQKTVGAAAFVCGTVGGVWSQARSRRLG